LNVRGSLAIGVVIFAGLVSNTALSQAQRWILPVPDGGDIEPSPPSVHGYLVAAAKQSVKVKRDSRDASVGTTVNVQLTSKTKFFTAYGGYYTPDELRSGQYVWVWYVTANPAEAGTPPRAAVVMLWSKDESDKPSPKVRWSFDAHKQESRLSERVWQYPKTLLFPQHNPIRRRHARKRRATVGRV